MPDVKVALGERSYSISIENGLLARAGEIIAPLAHRPRAAVVAQRKVWSLWGEVFADSLRASGMEVSVHLVPNGEGSKRSVWLQRLYAQFARAGVERSSLVVALGGGAVGDLAGFAAATWLRGVDFVQVPTTLLAQVDASVGGKVAVNMPFGKNLVGAFWQPKAVLVDPDVLKTLPRRDLRSGLAEVIKYGIILDRDFFRDVSVSCRDLLGLDGGAVAMAIRRSCELKAEVVGADERESGLRAILNYGHTIGHAVEKAAGYSRLRHGEAVAIGMVLAARIAVSLGMLPSEGVRDIELCVSEFGLPSEVPSAMDVDAVLSAMALDKKASGGRVKFVLPTGIGEVVISDMVTPDMVRQVVLDSQSGRRDG